MTNPQIQVNDEIREMTDEEYANYLENTKNSLLEPIELGTNYDD